MSVETVYTFTVRLPETDKETLKEISRQTGLKRADVVRFLIRQAGKNKVALEAPELIVHPQMEGEHA